MIFRIALEIFLVILQEKEIMPILTFINRKNEVFQVTVDQQDYDKVVELGKWYISNPGKNKNFYAEKKLTAKQFEKLNEERMARGLKPIKRKTLLMHRYILDLNCDNTYTDQVVDHIDGNGLNNTKSNLRLCSRSENSCNKRLRSNSQTGYRGVTERKPTQYFKKDGVLTIHTLKKQWKAYITPKGKKRITIGYYKNIEEAAKAYDEKAKELFGEFAKLNFQ